MTVIGHDIGATSGWAVFRADSRRSSGVHISPPSPHAERLTDWHEWVGQLYDAHQPAVVAYEYVRFPHQSTDAARLYYGIMTCIILAARARHCEVVAIPVQTVKMVATGRGNADKEAMLRAAKAQWPDQRIVAHDQADALWIAHAAALVSSGMLQIGSAFKSRKGRAFDNASSPMSPPQMLMGFSSSKRKRAYHG